jgi:hypothetical protein
LKSERNELFLKLTTLDLTKDNERNELMSTIQRIESMENKRLGGDKKEATLKKAKSPVKPTKELIAIDLGTSSASASRLDKSTVSASQKSFISVASSVKNSTRPVTSKAMAGGTRKMWK